jgi:curli biogenesis system outer membrane secretion channel CsgG
MGLKINRLGLVWIILCVLISGCATSRLQDTACTVAVWEVENIGVRGAMADTGGLMTARIMETLQTSGKCSTIEREKLDLALAELNLGASQLADESTRLQIGRLAGANRMIFGGFQTLGGTMRLDLRMVDVSTGAVIKTASQTADGADIHQWLQAAEKAAKEME